MQELAISEQHKEKQKKLDHDKAASKVEVFDSTPLLLETGYQQDPLEIPVCLFVQLYTCMYLEITCGSI